MTNAYFAGFLFYFALAAQLGPQNTFLLRQGILKQHNILVIITSILADTVLIAIGALGLGQLLNTHQAILTFTKAAGIAFLLWYSYHAVRRAFKAHNVEAAGADVLNRRGIIMACLAFSWLNPSTLFDLIVLLGTIAATYHAKDINFFALGAVAASALWLTSIVLMGRLIAPWFRKPLTWIILDVLVAIIMVSLATAMLLS